MRMKGGNELVRCVVFIMSGVGMCFVEISGVSVFGKAR